MLVGGGTGGHILPLLAVARSLRNKNRKIRIIAVIDKTTSFGHLLESSEDIDEVVSINAGKLRRYPNQKLLETILDFKTTVLNIRDGFRTIIGTFEAIKLLGRYKPDVIFIKGGFVGVPIGMGAKLKHIPFVTHDSDASPGLANRIIGRWATLHTVGMDISNYIYPKDKTIHVGIPVNTDFVHVTNQLKKAYRKEIGIPIDAKLIFITGGSQGAKGLNNIVSKISNSLVDVANVYVVHQTGPDPTPNLPINNKKYRIVDYIVDLYQYSGASDVIISRAGSSIAEFAIQQKAVIVIPAPQLADEHQIKNARILNKSDAVIVLSEAELNTDPHKLLSNVMELLNDSNRRTTLASNLSSVYPAYASDKIAKILIQEAG